MSSLYDAVQNERSGVVKRLIQVENVNYENQKYLKYTALHIACQKGFSNIARTLMSVQTIAINKRDYFRSTPLYLACWYNQYSIVRDMIFDLRVDLVATNAYGWSPFMAVCHRGSVESLKVLLISGRDLDMNAKSTKEYLGQKQGSTGIDMARKANQTQILQLIESYLHNPTQIEQNIREIGIPYGTTPKKSKNN